MSFPAAEKPTIMPIGAVQHKGITYTYSDVKGVDWTVPANIVATIPQTIPATTAWPTLSLLFFNFLSTGDDADGGALLSAVLMNTASYNGLVDLAACVDNAVRDCGPGIKGTLTIGATVIDGQAISRGVCPLTSLPRLASWIREKYIEGNKFVDAVINQYGMNDTRADRAKAMLAMFLTHLTEHASSAVFLGFLSKARKAIFDALLPPGSAPTVVNDEIVVPLQTSNSILKTLLMTDGEDGAADFIKTWLRWWALNHLDTVQVGDLELYAIESGSIQAKILQSAEDIVVTDGTNSFTTTSSEIKSSNQIDAKYGVSGADNTNATNSVTHDVQATLELPQLEEKEPSIDWTTLADIYPMISISGAISQGYKAYLSSTKGESWKALSQEEAANAEGINENRAKKAQFAVRDMKERGKAKTLSAPIVEIKYDQGPWDTIHQQRADAVRQAIIASAGEVDLSRYAIDVGDANPVPCLIVASHSATAADLPVVCTAEIPQYADKGDLLLSNIAVPEAFTLPVSAKTTIKSELDLILLDNKYYTFKQMDKAFAEAHKAAVDEYVNRLKDSDDEKDPDDHFPWWILGVIGAVAALAVGIAIYNSNKEKGSTQSSFQQQPTAASSSVEL